MVNKLIVALLAMVIGLALLPVVSTFATDMTAAAVTGGAVTNTLGTVITTSGWISVPAGQFYNTTTGSMIDLLPILFVIILIAGAVGFVVFKKKAD